jgi:hypothetical protein
MKIKTGDIFTIPIDDTRIGFGQIINIPNKNNFIIVIYKLASDKDNIPRLEEIVKEEILFLGYTLDAKLYHKHWLIIDNYIDNISTIPLPYYKLGTPPDVSIVDFKGDEIRNATQAEFDKLNYQTVVAPVRYENALKAFYKKLEWNDDFERLMYDQTLNSIKTVNGNKG